MSLSEEDEGEREQVVQAHKNLHSRISGMDVVSFSLSFFNHKHVLALKF